MKITGGKADAFTRSPDPAAQCILIYGPDTGLVRERLDKLTRSVVDDPSDPFLVAELGLAQVKETPSLLAEESAALAMTGGRRVVRLRDADDSLSKTLDGFLADIPGDALILLSAGDLPARSKLRKLFEGAKNAVALPCYSDDQRALDALVRDHMREAGVEISPDAVAFVAENLGADRAASRSELEKLVLYAGAEKRITADDAFECVGNAAAYSLDNVIYTAFDGNAPALENAVQRAWEEGVSPVALARMSNNHVLRLMDVHAKAGNGGDIGGVIRSLRPPVFYKLVDRFTAQARNWNRPALSKALELLLEAETDCKRSGKPDRLLTARCLQQIAAIARQQRRR